MGQWYDNFDNPANVELGTCWVVQAGGFHIFRAPSGRAGGRDVNWLRTNNIAAGDYRISHVAPPPIDTSISVEWEWLFGLTSEVAARRMWLFCNDPTLNVAAAGVQGYFLQINIAAPTLIFLFRANGGGAVTQIGATYNWAGADINDHRFRVTREMPNSTWRVYLDESTTPIIGPINDATHTNALYYGERLRPRDRVGEILISS